MNEDINSFPFLADLRVQIIGRQCQLRAYHRERGLVRRRRLLLRRHRSQRRGRRPDPEEL